MDNEEGPDKTTWIPSGNRISIFSSPAAGFGTSARCTAINPEPGLDAKSGLFTGGVINLFLATDPLVNL